MKPLYELKNKILQHYERQFKAAQDLNISDSELSLVVMGRKQLTEEFVCKLEQKLKCKRKDFLPDTHPLMKCLKK